jgi:hypothetical protein
MLREFLLRCAADVAIGSEYDGPRTGGALIEGEHEFHGTFPWSIPSPE